MNTHYYILPDGRRAEDLYEAAILLGTSKRQARKLVKRGQIEKVLITIQTEEHGNNEGQVNV